MQWRDDTTLASRGLCVLMTARGQERRISAVRKIFALPPRADVGADIVERPFRANSCREQMQQHDVCKGRTYSINSSARPDRGSGTVMPSALAVFRLMYISTLVTCWTGRSAGFSPLRIRPVYMPAMRYDSLISGP
jgi:hypothetical protein